MAAQELHELLLVGNVAMMLCLACDVRFNFGEARFADRKRSVSVLPAECAMVGERLMKPLGGIGLDYAQQVGNGLRGRECSEQMNVIRYSADAARKAFFILNDAADYS
jgi:hypothetical protein